MSEDAESIFLSMVFGFSSQMEYELLACGTAIYTVFVVEGELYESFEYVYDNHGRVTVKICYVRFFFVHVN